jgi:hypothetical protein
MHEPATINIRLSKPKRSVQGFQRKHTHTLRSRPTTSGQPSSETLSFFTVLSNPKTPRPPNKTKSLTVKTCSSSHSYRIPHQHSVCPRTSRPILSPSLQGRATREFLKSQQRPLPHYSSIKSGGVLTVESPMSKMSAPANLVPNSFLEKNGSVHSLGTHTWSSSCHSPTAPRDPSPHCAIILSFETHCPSIEPTLGPVHGWHPRGATFSFGRTVIGKGLPRTSSWWCQG